MPVVDEAPILRDALARLESLRARGAEVIVSDGGSADGTREIARTHADRLAVGRRGRALQMNAGARLATGSILLFLHADTRLPDGADRTVREALGRDGRQWGRFDVRIDADDPPLRMIGTMMNLRSRLTGIATGDQAIFVRRAAFESVGGFPEIALMEDIALSRMLKRRAGRPACVRARVLTSARRWQRGGVWRTMALMWRLRLAFFLGADPGDLARRYEQQRH